MEIMQLFIRTGCNQIIDAQEYVAMVILSVYVDWTMLVM